MPAAPRFHVVIPARYASTRLPGKALADIAGKPMVVRVAERARAAGPASVWIATDHVAILEAARTHGCDALMTRVDHASGTDRIAEAARALDLGPQEIVVNVQGDEPLMPPALIAALAQRLAESTDAAIATAAYAITDAADLFNPNVVKVVTDRSGYALYFSRAPIPWARDAFAASREALPTGAGYQRHVGIYAYRVSFLAAFTRLAPAALEAIEALEQLRALWHGYRIAVMQAAEAPPAGVDTPEDLERARRLFAAV